MLSASVAFRNVGYALQGKPTIQAQPPLNAPRLIDLLFDVHGHQVLPAFCIFTLPITLLQYFCFPSLLLTTLTRLLAPSPCPLNAHGHQLLHDGFFNGDPHPGNIMLLEDGRVGLIDWGQVKRIGKEERLRIARLVIALADRDQLLTAQLWRDCGFVTKHMDEWCLDK